MVHNVRGESSCVLIEGSREDYDYDYGNKVLNFAIEVQEDGYDPQYEHYSVAVRGRDNIAFQTYARFDWASNDIYACTEDPRQEGCTNSATAFTNLQQMLAVSMSTTSRFYRPMPPMNLRVE